MPILSLSRYGVALLLAVLVSGCGSSGSGLFSGGSTYRSSGEVSNECLRDRRSCIHEGRYEQGERAYAEDEARRLNQAQLDRLRRLAVK